MTASTKPIHEIRLGAIKAAIWEQQTEHGARYSVTLCRLYKDGTLWKRTGSFARDDLLVVARVSELAFGWVHARNETERPRIVVATS